MANTFCCCASSSCHDVDLIEITAPVTLTWHTHLSVGPDYISLSPWLVTPDHVVAEPTFWLPRIVRRRPISTLRPQPLYVSQLNLFCYLLFPVRQPDAATPLLLPLRSFYPFTLFHLSVKMRILAGLERHLRHGVSNRPVYPDVWDSLVRRYRQNR